MKALIIADGQGNRLENPTKDKPKPLIQLLGLSLIERVILTAKQSGINEFAVVGYPGEKIRSKLGNGEKLGVKIDYVENKEWEKGNGVSVLKAKKLFYENSVLLPSDHIFDARILEELVNYKFKSSVVVAVDRITPSLEDTKVLEKEGRIIDIGKEIKESNCIDTGIFLCSHKIFSYIEETLKEGETELAHCIAKAARAKDAEIFNITNINHYIPSMRKEVRPWWFDIDSKEDLLKAEKFIVQNACKGRNDLLATYINKPIENFIVKRIANTAITPNQVTIITNIIAYLATFLFFEGQLLIASAITFIVSFMDGVDGKLSRVKLITSGLGKMEHAFDYLFEHSWYIALSIYLSNQYGTLPLLLGIFILLFDGFSDYSGNTFGKVIKTRPLHDYGKAEQIFRKFDGRKNTYIIFILIGVLLNNPILSLYAIVIWSFISALFYCYRTMKHIFEYETK